MTTVLVASRYEVGEIIGRGGMADVHAGRDTRLDREVAVKIMRPGTATPADMAARFEDEARIAASLTHPNVVAVYDTGLTDEGCPFIVMERLPGHTLADRMREGPLDEPELRAIAGDVLGALGAAHAAGIVHRDVKPGNILLTEDGRAKIADFGIARESDALLVDPTTTSATTGTPAYLAPERIDGAPATARSDIWGLGVVLYEALAGRKPFEGPTPLAVAIAVRENTPPPLPSIRPAVDPVLAAAVDRAMAADPADRFGGAAEMLGALDGHLPDPDATVIERGAPVAGDATVVVAPAPLPWWQRVPRRRLALAGAATAAILLLVGVGLVAGLDADDPTPANPASAVVPTTVAPPAESTTITTGAPAVVVQNEPAPVVVEQPRRRAPAKGKKGGRD